MNKVVFFHRPSLWLRRRRRQLPRQWTAYQMWWGCRRVLLLGRAGWGISAFAVFGRRQGAHTGVYQLALSGVSTMKRRKSSAQSADVLHLAPVESTVLSRHMALVAHCSQTRYDDGDPRLPGWFTVKTMGSAWVVEVKDPDECMRLVVIQATLDDALSLTCLLLEGDEAPWEADPWLTAARAKKRK